MKDLFLIKNKKTGVYQGFLDSTHPVKSSDADLIYVEITDGQYQKILSGWTPVLDSSNKIVDIQKPQWITDQENEQSRIQALKEKIKNGMATQAEKDELLLLIS